MPIDTQQVPVIYVPWVEATANPLVVVGSEVTYESEVDPSNADGEDEAVDAGAALYTAPVLTAGGGGGNSIAPPNARVIITSNSTATWVTSSTASGTSIFLPHSDTASTTSTASYFYTSVGTWYTPTSGTCWVVVGGGGGGGQYVPPKPNIKEKLRLRDKVRGSIKRALKLMDNLGMSDDLKIFLSGGSVELSHPDSLFKFVLTQREGSLLARTQSPGYSTPYQLELYTKSDVHIADLCVYMTDTPILDQVLAMAMFIRTGCEDEILTSANFFNRCRSPELLEALVKDVPYLANKLH